MRALLPLVFGLVLLWPVNSRATEIFFLVSDDGELAMSFGLEPFTLDSGPFDGIRLDGIEVDPTIRGSVDSAQSPLRPPRR